ncbi:MAG: serine hydrolase, partial [Sphingobacteriales bacterium]
MNRKTLLLSATVLFASTGLLAQALPVDSIDALVERTREAFDVPGIAVAVIKDGKVVLARGYGYRSLASKAPVNEHTAFGIASNSKALTAAALGMLVDEGKLGWDDKVIKYIPEFRLYDPWVTKEFTIRDLLTHRSGLGLGAGDLMFFPDSTDFTIKDIIQNLRFLKPVSGFRTKYDYDNNLYIVAGEVLARVSGMSWMDFIQQRFLDPIGMPDSAPTYERLRSTENVIDAHAPVEGTVRVIRRHTEPTGNAAGSIYSSVADMAKWVQVQLDHGKYNGGKQLFSDAVHEEQWTPQTIIPVRSPGYYGTHFGSYGLGFFLSDVKGYKQVTHTGSLEGMVTQVTMLPELGLGIIVLTNQQEGGAFSAITNTIKDAYLGLPRRDWVSLNAQNRKAALANGKHITDSIGQIVALAAARADKGSTTGIEGTYRDAWFGDVLIAPRNGQLWFTSRRSPKLNGPMYRFKDNTFIVKWTDRSMDADTFAEFTVDVKGKVTGIRMKPISPLTDFSYDFQ